MTLLSKKDLNNYLQSRLMWLKREAIKSSGDRLLEAKGRIRELVRLRDAAELFAPAKRLVKPFAPQIKAPQIEEVKEEEVKTNGEEINRQGEEGAGSEPSSVEDTKAGENTPAGHS